jgi:DNA-binding winged helix-turn-helix (wHTH) protein
MAESSPPLGFRLGAFTIDLRARKLRRGPDVILLPARAFDALVYLVSHRGRAIDKDEIVAAVWRDVAVTDDSLIHAVSVLRRVLGDDAGRRPETIVEDRIQ